MNKLHVVISGIHYPLWMGRYFINAFERRDDIELFTVGPFTGDWIPWAGGLRLPQKYVKTPNFPLAPSSIPIEVPISLIETQLPWKPDLFLSIDAGWHVTGRPRDTKVFAQIQTDPHVLKEHYNKVKGQYDVVFGMQGPYLEQGEVYLPYAFDLTIHYPIPGMMQEYDACLIGLQYEHRNRLVSTLVGQGITVRNGIGVVYDEYREAYNKSKIALSWSSLKDLPARVFEAFGMSVPLVTNRVPDLNNFFVERDHYLGFNTVDEAVEQVKFLLNNPKFAHEMSDSAYRKALAGHTWDHRVQSILEVCKLI